MNFVTLILAIIGATICFKRLHNIGNIYRYGLWFFALIGLSEILSLLFSTFIINKPFLGTDPKQIGWILAVIQLPEQIARWAGLIVLTLGFYRHHSTNNQ